MTALARLRRYWRAGKNPYEADVPTGHPFPVLHSHVHDCLASLNAAARCATSGEHEMVRMHLILLDRAAEAASMQSNRELAARHGLCDDEDVFF